MSPETRATLIDRVRDPDDRSAWEEFFALYAPLIEAFARSHGLSASDAEEVRDQCLAVVAQRMPDFRYERVRGGFKGWLYTIVRGKVVDHLRRRPQRIAQTTELAHLADPRPSPDTAWDQHWRAEHLRYGLAEARRRESPRVYRAFEMLLLDERTVPEVCATLGMNANQVYKAKSRVLGRVRATLARLESATDQNDPFHD